MSLRLLRRPARQLLARSHAASNTCSIARPSTRAFHASAPRQGPILDAILYIPHEMMTLIHAQIPWYAAIPVSAFLLRAALVTSFGSWARSLMARYIGLQPLRQALARQKHDEAMRQLSKEGGARTPKEAKQRTMGAVKTVVAELDSRWKVTIKGQIAWTLLQLPVFFTMAELVRKMCGARDGLLALAASSLATAKGTVKRWFGGGAADSPDPLDASPTTTTDVVGTAEALSAPDALSVTSTLHDTTALSDVEGLATSPFFEPSLATEGMLWFPNLILPDPFLPFIASGLMFSNIYFSKNAPTTEKNWPNAIRRSLLVLSVFIGPLCQGLPAGLMLYWVSSTTSVIVWNRWLDWKYPAPKDFAACKRPLQMPPSLKLKNQARKF
ncbi:hypothetical protein G6514_000926 [Epicoccum nigrum]|nr:hypothetical protein G6514_000926 [Epicoccum nigrum]